MNADSIEVQQDGLLLELLQHWLLCLWLLWHLAPLFPSGPRTGGMQSETADQSATSGPGHNTTTGGDEPLESQEEAVAGTGPGAEQIPDSDITFGRETSTQDTPTAGQQGLNNTGNGTNGGLENPLSENITSLTGT